YLGPWLLSFTRNAPGVFVVPGSRWEHLKNVLVFAEGPLRTNLTMFWEWLGNGLKTDVDKWVAAVAMASALLYLSLGARGRLAAKEDPEPAGRGWLGWAALVLAAGYFLLPLHVHWPTDWWGARVRFVVPLFLVGIIASRPWRYGLDARWAAIPVLA